MTSCGRQAPGFCGRAARRCCNSLLCSEMLCWRRVWRLISCCIPLLLTPVIGKQM